MNSKALLFIGSELADTALAGTLVCGLQCRRPLCGSAQCKQQLDEWSLGSGIVTHGATANSIQAAPA